MAYLNTHGDKLFEALFKHTACNDGGSEADGKTWIYRNSFGLTGRMSQKE